MGLVDRKVREIKEPVAFMQLHVQKVNEKAVEFYRKQGFSIVEEIEKYYDLEDGAAFKMRKDLI